MSLTQKNKKTYDTSIYKKAIQQKAYKTPAFHFISASKYRYNSQNKCIPLIVAGASDKDVVVFTGDHVIGDSLVYVNCGSYKVTATKRGRQNQQEQSDTVTIIIEKAKIKSYQIDTPTHHYYSTSLTPIPLQVSNIDDDVLHNIQFFGSCVKNSHLHYLDVGMYEVVVSNCESQNYLCHKESFVVNIHKNTQESKFIDVAWDYSPTRKKIILPYSLKNTKVEYSLVFPTDPSYMGNVRLEENIIFYSCPGIVIQVQSYVENQNFKIVSNLNFIISKTSVEELRAKDIPMKFIHDDPYYTLTDILEIYPLTELLSCGYYSLRELNDAGVDSFCLFETKQVSISNMENAGYNMLDLSKKLKAAYSIEELLDLKQLKLEDLKTLGYGVKELLVTKKVSIRDLQYAGFYVKFRIG